MPDFNLLSKSSKEKQKTQFHEIMGYRDAPKIVRLLIRRSNGKISSIQQAVIILWILSILMLVLALFLFWNSRDPQIDSRSSQQEFMGIE